MVGGQLRSWSRGFHAGYWEFFFITSLVAPIFICLALCLAEMASMLPFAGGLYGYVRCGLGPVVGYLVGCSEALRYILFISAGVGELGNIIGDLLNAPAVIPVLWLIFYAFSVPLHGYGGRCLWIAITLFGVSSLLVIIVYCLGCLHFSPHVQPTDDISFGSHGVTAFNTYFATARLFYLGTDVLTLAGGEVKSTVESVPRALMGVIATGVVTSFCLLLATAALPPGVAELAEETYPLVPGWTQILSIPLQYSPLLALPGVVGNAFGFLVGCSRQLRSMAASGLFPQFLLASYQPTAQNTPIAAMLSASLLSYVILLILYYAVDDYMYALFHLCMCSSSITYICLFAAYVHFKLHFGNITRPFQSPLGLFGACYGIVLLSYLTITVFFLDDSHPQHRYRSFYLYMAFNAIAAGYYYCIARKREFFSAEEAEQFFRVYLVRGECGLYAPCMLMLSMH